MVSLPSAARFRSSFILPFRGPSAVSFSAAFLLVVFFFIAGLLVCTSRVRIWDLIPFRWRPALSSHLGKSLNAHCADSEPRQLWSGIVGILEWHPKTFKPPRPTG